MAKTVKKTKKAGKKNVQAIKSTLDGIKFDSNLEKFCYTELKSDNLHEKLKYEGKTFVIIEGFEFQGKKYQSVKITPDFVDEDKKVIIECKGYMRQNALFPMRWKIMKKYFADNKLDYDIHLVFNQGEIKEAIKQVKLKHYT
jgi:hypothetical protein